VVERPGRDPLELTAEESALWRAAGAWKECLAAGTRVVLVRSSPAPDDSAVAAMFTDGELRMPAPLRPSEAPGRSRSLPGLDPCRPLVPAYARTGVHDHAAVGSRDQRIDVELNDFRQFDGEE
jgi:hypothetical protein